MSSVNNYFTLKNNLALFIILSMALKDIRSSLTERAFLVTSIIIPINFLLLFLLFALTGGEAPTAVVLEDHGPYAMQFVSAMEHSHSFIIQQTSPGEAQNLMQQGRIVPLAITSFYANAFPNKVVISAHEIDTYSHDTGYIQ